MDNFQPLDKTKQALDAMVGMDLQYTGWKKADMVRM